jgi:hypothetical protein
MSDVVTVEFTVDDTVEVTSPLGALGVPGPPGPGLPLGGTTGQAVVKLSDDDNDTGWGTPEVGVDTEYVDDAVAGEATAREAADEDLASDIEVVADQATATAQDLVLHAADTGSVHGIPDTTALETQASADAKVAAEALLRQEADDDEATARVAADLAETGARTAADLLLIPLAQRAAPTGVATLDAAGKIPSIQIPALTLGPVFVVADEAEMLTLVAVPGDVAKIVGPPPLSYILQGNDPSDIDDWVSIEAGDAVTSVDGQIGSVDLTDVYAPLSEVQARTDAIAAEIDERQDADTAEAAARIQGDADEATARAAADLTLVTKNASFNLKSRYDLNMDGDPNDATDNVDKINTALQDAAASGLTGARVEFDGGIVVIDNPIILPHLGFLDGDEYNSWLVRKKGTIDGDAMIKTEGFADAAGTICYNPKLRGVCLDGLYVKFFDGVNADENPAADAPGGPGSHGICFYANPFRIRDVHVKNVKGRGLVGIGGSTFGPGVALKQGLVPMADHFTLINCYGDLDGIGGGGPKPWMFEWGCPDGQVEKYEIFQWDDVHLTDPGAIWPWNSGEVGNIAEVISGSGNKIGKRHVYGQGSICQSYVYGTRNVFDPCTLESPAPDGTLMWVRDKGNVFIWIDGYDNTGVSSGEGKTFCRLGHGGSTSANALYMRGNVRKFQTLWAWDECDNPQSVDIGWEPADVDTAVEFDPAYGEPVLTGGHYNMETVVL